MIPLSLSEQAHFHFLPAIFVPFSRRETLLIILQETEGVYVPDKFRGTRHAASANDTAAKNELAQSAAHWPRSLYRYHHCDVLDGQPQPLPDGHLDRQLSGAGHLCRVPL